MTDDYDYVDDRDCSAYECPTCGHLEGAEGCTPIERAPTLVVRTPVRHLMGRGRRHQPHELFINVRYLARQLVRVAAYRDDDWLMVLQAALAAFELPTDRVDAFALRILNTNQRVRLEDEIHTPGLPRGHWPQAVVVEYIG